MKEIIISLELEKDIVAFCEDELNYHINESGCAQEYDSEIKAQIKLLDLLGYNDMAASFAKQYQRKVKGELNRGNRAKIRFVASCNYIQ